MNEVPTMEQKLLNRISAQLGKGSDLSNVTADVRADIERMIKADVSFLALMKQEFGDSVSVELVKRSCFQQPDAVNGHNADVYDTSCEPADVAAVVMDPTEIKQFLKCYKDGRIKNDFANYQKILEMDPMFAGKIHYNQMDGRIMLTDFSWQMEPHPLRDSDLVNIRAYLSNVYGIENTENIRQALIFVAHKNQVHPFRSRLRSFTWDGQHRIAELYHRYLGAEPSEYLTAVTKLQLYGTIRRVFDPGIKFDTATVLQDTKQGTGKSTMCKFLALDDRWFTDQLDDLGDIRTAFETIRGKAIIELSEMIATRKTKEKEAIKSFISRTADEYRQPYSTYSETYLRQCIFIGTTNKPQFLPDDKTGNRRFLPIICDGTKAEIHPLANEAETRHYIEQCYAEAMVMGEREKWPLTLDRRFEEKLVEIRDAATPDDGMAGMIQEWLGGARDDKGIRIDCVCSRMIWDKVFATTPSKFDLQEVADVMNLKITGWTRKEKKCRVGRYGTQRVWVRDPVGRAATDVAGNTQNDVGTGDDSFVPAVESPFTLGI